MKKRLLLICCVFAAPAQALTLDVPIACAVGRDCFVQNFVDHADGTDYRDFTCGQMSYDGHKGTDIRLRNLGEMRSGVNVIAAAPGKVRAIRDGVEDINFREADKATIQNKECGNGLVVVTQDGYETQYCHMKRGSIAVRPGEEVRVGQVLGQVGLSGMTEFPHLHFEVRKNSAVIDPYTGTNMQESCQVRGQPLWSETAQKQMQYLTRVVLNMGFAPGAADEKKARNGDYASPSLPAAAAALSVWVEVMGVEAGDTLLLELTGPDGAPLATRREPVAKHKAVVFESIGIKSRQGMPLPAGIYKATASIIPANGKASELGKMEKTVTLQ